MNYYGADLWILSAKGEGQCFWAKWGRWEVRWKLWALCSSGEGGGGVGIEEGKGGVACCCLLAGSGLAIGEQNVAVRSYLAGTAGTSRVGPSCKHHVTLSFFASQYE